MRSHRAGAVLAGAMVAMACGGSEAGATRDTTSSTKPASVEESPAAGSAATPAPDGARRTVLFLGTSLTAGYGLEPDSAYPQQIQRKIDASGLPYETVNAGVSGETSAGLLRRLEWVLRRPAEVIVVETGANDGLRGQPVAATRATIDQILTRIRRERPEATIVLAQMEAPTNLGVQYTTAFREMFPSLASQHGVTLMPFLLDSVAGRPSMNQSDGVHPNYAGERVVTENVWRTLQGILKG